METLASCIKKPCKTPKKSKSLTTYTAKLRLQHMFSLYTNISLCETSYTKRFKQKCSVSECAKYARLIYAQSKTELTELPDPTTTLPDEPQIVTEKTLKWFCRWQILQKLKNIRTDKITNGTKASFYVEWLTETENKNDEIMMQKLNTVSQLAVAQQILLKIIGNLE